MFILNEKIIRLLEQDINPILCIGESKEERENNTYFDVLKKEIEEVQLEEEFEKEVKTLKGKKVKKAVKTASPKINFVSSTYYKGTPIENVTKKLEEYLDNASVEEHNINYI